MTKRLWTLFERLLGPKYVQKIRHTYQVKHIFTICFVSPLPIANITLCCACGVLYGRCIGNSHGTTYKIHMRRRVFLWYATHILGQKKWETATDLLHLDNHARRQLLKVCALLAWRRHAESCGMGIYSSAVAIALWRTRRYRWIFRYNGSHS